MPRKLELTWQKGAGNRKGRWRKWYKGKAYHFSYGDSKSDMVGYRQAVAAWEKKKAEIDAAEAQRPKPHQEEYENAIEEWTLVLQWSVDHGDEQFVAIARDKIQKLRDRSSQKDPPPIVDGDRLWWQFRWREQWLDQITASFHSEPPPDPNDPGTIVPEPWIGSREDGTPERIEEEVWRDRIQSQRRKAKVPEVTVETNVEAYLAVKEAQLQAGKLTAGRYIPIKLHLEDFRDWIGPNTEVATISGKALSDYHVTLMQRIAQREPDAGSGFKTKKGLSADYARDRISAVKSFIRWLYEVDAIPVLPRILANKNALTIGKKRATPETFTIDEVKTLLAAATQRSKLFLLLMLNTGAYQGDISELKQTEVDWVAGRITRKRSKTREHERVPVVSYVLWRETFQLLLQERATEGDRVLLNERGGPLKVEELGVDGKLRKIDNIATAFSRVRRTTKINKPLKLFRKTSATLIRSQKQYTGLAELFLGLAPSSVADAHYAGAPQALLDEAIQWLGRQYGIA